MQKKTKTIKIHISSMVFLFIALSFWAGEAKAYFLFLFSAAIHEYLHMFAAMLCNVEVYSLCLVPWGLKLTTGFLWGTKGKIILLAGPVGSFLIALLCYFTNNFQLCQVNLALFLLNLIPALPLDGGRILYLITKNAKFCKELSFTCSIILLVLSPFSFWFLPISTLILYSVFYTSPNLFNTEMPKTLEKKEKNVYNIKKDKGANK